MSDIGIYMIVHRATGLAYVGQSINIPNRWMEHMKQLNDGSHHNRNLLELWTQHGGAAFEFRVVCHAPDGLSPLETQRWLAKKEAEVYSELKWQRKALNIAIPEIVETVAAYDEFKRREPEIVKEEDRLLLSINQTVTSGVRDVKERMSQVQTQLVKCNRALEAADLEAVTARRRLKRNTGWERLLFGITDSRPQAVLEQAVREAEDKLNALQSEHMQLEKLEPHLREQMRRAYNSYPRNSDRHLRRTLLFSGLPPKNKPRIR